MARMKVVALCAALLLPVSLSALVVMGPNQNHVPPTVPGAENLADYIGELLTVDTPGYLGTAIGPRHFLTAAHIPFAVGDPFFYRGRQYQITNRSDLAGTDFTVGTVDADFPGYVEMYDRQDEEGRGVVMLGKGRWKGDPLLINGELKGWLHAESGPPGIRWGTNVIQGIRNVPFPVPGQAGGSFLVGEFDRAAGDDEAHFTFGDSGGPVFIEDCGVWKLAGIASAIQGPFVPTGDDVTPPYLAALFDTGGFSVVRTPNPPTVIPDTDRDVPSYWLASRVSARLGGLRTLVGFSVLFTQPQPADQFAWMQESVAMFIPITLPAWPPGAGIGCVDTVSTAGATLTTKPDGADYVTPAQRPAVDIFRYVLRREGYSSTWGRVFVVAPPRANDRPSVGVARDGTAVVCWPVEQGQFKQWRWASGPQGPWWGLGTFGTLLDGFSIVADPIAGTAQQRFYRYD